MRIDSECCAERGVASVTTLLQEEILRSDKAVRAECTSLSVWTGYDNLSFPLNLKKMRDRGG
jgi:hypothetical protein